ncbi:MAG: ATP-dependent zinc metalloprotease FtsH [Desulfobacterales bacterium]|nr:ATP-dependent zinc metalloprotease FtsH [Desulfobacterales bacterium]MBF0395841.1 ATP-dependent zinc metalloprotease FtsH [Desulfobacterales bacterium]
MQNTTRFNVFYAFMAMMGVIILHDLWVGYRSITPLAYSEFQKLVREGKVKEIIITADEIRGELKVPEKPNKKYFRTTRVESGLAEELLKHDVKFSGHVESTFFTTLLSWILPTLFFFGIWFLIMRRMSSHLGAGGAFMSIGKSKAKVYVENDTKITFADIAGVDEAKAELTETVDFLKNPEHYSRLGARMPKGVLLVGPPGTGKTLLAKAVAGEAGVPFFSISGSDFVEMFVGVGAARVRDLFEQARLKAPAIIFIDELDAMGRARGSSPFAGGHDEKEQTLNQLLVEMDGFDSMSGIVLLAATNRPEVLDPALLRAGRFDRQILVDRPDKQGRLAILKVHVHKVMLEPDTDLEQVAALTPGFSGADLSNLVNEAALAATRRGGKGISLADFNTGVERIVAGLERKNRLLNSREREIVAYHEMGHAIAAAAVTGADPVHKVSIIPRGIGALGYTIQRPTEDRYLMTREELENRMVVLMGGRAAEHVVFTHFSTGAADDLTKISDIARSMVTRYAMEPQLGHVAFETDQRSFLGPTGEPLRQRLYGDETAREIDCAIRRLVLTAFDRSVSILTENRSVLEESARLLLKKETLDAGDLEGLFQALKPASTDFTPSIACCSKE